MPGMKSYSPTINQLRLPLILLITFAHSYSGVRAGDYIVETMLANERILSAFASLKSKCTKSRFFWFKSTSRLQTS